MNMLKKSKIVALLTVSVMMFAVVQSAFAWGNRTGSRGGDAAAYGTGAGAVAAGVAAAALIFFTGGLAAPVVIGAAAVAGAAGAAGGAYYGYNVEEKSLAKDVGVIAAAGAGGGVVAAAAPVAAPYVAGVVGAGGAAATAGKEFLKSTAQNAVNEFKKHPIQFAMGSYSAVQGVAAIPQILEKFNSPKLEKKLQHLEDLAKEGKNVTVLEVRQITPTRLAIKYTVNGVEYSETIDNK